MNDYIFETIGNQRVLVFTGKVRGFQTAMIGGSPVKTKVLAIKPVPEVSEGDRIDPRGIALLQYLMLASFPNLAVKQFTPPSSPHPTYLFRVPLSQVDEAATLKHQITVWQAAKQILSWRERRRFGEFEFWVTFYPIQKEIAK